MRGKCNEGKSIRRLGAVLALLALGAIAAVPGALAQEGQSGAGATGLILDKTVAKVDEETVLLSDLLSDLQLYMVQSGQMPSREEQQQLLEEFRESRIQEKLLVAKARRDDIQVTDADVEQALDQHVARLNQQAGGEARLLRQLEQEGLTLRALRKRLAGTMHDQLLAQRVIERLDFDINVTEEQSRAFFEENKDNPDILPLRPGALELAHLLVLPKAAPDKEDAARQKIQAIQDRLVAGEDFAELAKELSDGPAASRGGDLGWFRIQDLAIPELQRALVNLPDNQPSELVRSGQGMHILEITERAGDQVHFRQIFVEVPLSEENHDLARTRAREAWQKLQAGEEWDQVVLDYSDEEITRTEGGLLPPIPEGQLDERYSSVIEALEPGEYSSVFQGERGFQIVRLISREGPRPYRYEEISDQLRDQLIYQRRNEAVLDYINGLETEILVTREEIPDLDSIAGMGSQG